MQDEVSVNYCWVMVLLPFVVPLDPLANVPADYMADNIYRDWH